MQNEILPGVELGDVRLGEATAKRNDGVRTAESLRGGESVRVLDDADLSRGLRDVCEQRDPVQSREPAARRNVRDEKDYESGGGNSRGEARYGVSRKSGRETRLGLRAGIRGSHLENAATRRWRRHCHRHGRSAFGARIRGRSIRVRRTGLAKAREKFAAVQAAAGSGLPDRGHAQGEGAVRMAGARGIPRVGGNHGGCGRGSRRRQAERTRTRDSGREVQPLEPLAEFGDPRDESGRGTGVAALRWAEWDFGKNGAWC